MAQQQQMTPAEIDREFADREDGGQADFDAVTEYLRNRRPRMQEPQEPTDFQGYSTPGVAL